MTPNVKPSFENPPRHVNFNVDTRMEQKWFPMQNTRESPDQVEGVRKFDLVTENLDARNSKPKTCPFLLGETRWNY